MNLFQLKRRLIIVFTTTFMLGNLLSQKIEQFTINSGGDILSNHGKTLLSFSIADPFINVVKTNSNVLTQGFQQPFLNSILTGFNSESFEAYKILIYPNPSENQTLILFPENTKFEIKMKIIDMKGSIIFSENIKIGTSQYYLNTSNLIPGQYSIIMKSPKKLFTYKLLKL